MIRRRIGVHVVVLAGWPQSEKALLLLLNLRVHRRVPSNVRHAFGLVVELLNAHGNNTEAGNIGVFFGALEQSLQTNANSHERLTGLDVFTDWAQESALLQLRETVAEVADTREN